MGDVGRQPYQHSYLRPNRHGAGPIHRFDTYKHKLSSKAPWAALFIADLVVLIDVIEVLHLDGEIPGRDGDRRIGHVTQPAGERLV